MDTKAVDLPQVFSAVHKELLQNKSSLNDADTYNHDHGDNVVEVFKVVTQATHKKQDASASEQLAYASQVLRTKSTSGSAKLYADGLANAAENYRGKSVTSDNAMELITSLMGSSLNQQQSAASEADPMSALLSGMLGGEQADVPSVQDPLGGLAGSLLSGMLGGGQQQAGADPLSSLLSGAMGGAQQPSQSSADPLSSLLSGALGGSQQAAGAAADPLSSLLGGMLGGTESAQGAQQAEQQGGLNAADLLQAGMAFMQAKQQGASSIQALIGAVMSTSIMKGSPHREQSGALIVNTLLQAIGSMAKK